MNTRLVSDLCSWKAGEPVYWGESLTLSVGYHLTRVRQLTSSALDGSVSNLFYQAPLQGLSVFFRTPAGGAMFQPMLVGLYYFRDLPL